MQKLSIICIDDQREVLAALVNDLSPLTTHCRIEICESTDEAMEVMEEFDQQGTPVGLIISDHVMPGKSGIAFLTEINEEPRFQMTPKLLVTGMATHQETIMAINRANIDRYIEKPWEVEDLLRKVKELLTERVFSSGLDYQQYLPVLDQQTLLSRLHSG